MAGHPDLIKIYIFFGVFLGEFARGCPGSLLCCGVVSCLLLFVFFSLSFCSLFIFCISWDGCLIETHHQRRIKLVNSQSLLAYLKPKVDAVYVLSLCIALGSCLSPCTGFCLHWIDGCKYTYSL